MNRKILFSSITSLVGTSLILVLALAFDNLIDYLKVLNARTFAVTPILLWAYPLTDLVLAIGLLLLFRYVNSRATVHAVVYIIFLVVGLLTLLYLPITSSIMNVLPLPALLTLRLKLIYSGAFIAVTGFLGIIRPRMSNGRI